jgi:hypothetical protein
VRVFAELELDSTPLTWVHFKLYAPQLVAVYFVVGIIGAFVLSIALPWLPVAAWVLGPVNHWFVIRSEWKKRLKHPVRYEFSDDEILASTEGIASKIAWSKINRVQEVHGHWALFWSEREYMIVPLKQLSSTERATLLDMLKIKQIRGAHKLG